MQLEFIETGACGEKYVLWLIVGVCLSFLWSIYAPRGVVKWANYIIILFSPMGEE